LEGVVKLKNATKLAYYQLYSAILLTKFFRVAFHTKAQSIAIYFLENNFPKIQHIFMKQNSNIHNKHTAVHLTVW